MIVSVIAGSTNAVAGICDIVAEKETLLLII